MLKTTRVLFLTLLLFIFITYSSFHYGDTDKRLPYFQSHGAAPKQDSSLDFSPAPRGLEAVHNSTLGFQQVFVVNLPERSDKLDAFALSSSLTGFSAQLIEGVHGQDVPNKSLPTVEGLPKGEARRNNIVGCWRAHLNFARTMINENLQTALVIEDDADWDIHLKSQLSLFAQGSQYIVGTPSKKRPFSPYGDGWDLLWLGHCSSQIKFNDQRRYVIENDETVPNPKHRINFSDNVPDMAAEGLGDNTRLIFEANSGLCTYSYALSLQGAKKLLQTQSTIKEFQPIDIGLNKMCNEDSAFKCISSFPQIIDSHKAAGGVNKDSDIEIPASKEAETRSHSFTFNIVYSTRLNLDRMLRGEKVDKTWRQWPEEPVLEGPPRTRTLSRQA